MMNLYEYLRKVYEELLNGNLGFEKPAYEFIKSTSYDNLMDDENKCIEFISKVYEFDISPDIFVYNKERAKHIIVTFLLGLGLKNIFDLKESIDSDIRYNSIWIQSSMLHDYGYFIDEYKQSDLTIDDITSKYNLLTDEYNGVFDDLNGLTKSGYKCYFPYEYEEIIKYFNYKKKYSKEINDHGIVGGCLAFEKYCIRVAKYDKKFYELKGIHYRPSHEINRQQKIACYTAATHNIFKSSTKKTDKKYLEFDLKNLLSTSKKRIKVKNKLLMLLSLVDTIECSKRFSKRENPNEYLFQKTILENVVISTSNNSITIDYSNLFLHISKRKNNEALKRSFNYQMNSVKTIYKWTDFKCYKNSFSEYSFIISL